MVDDTDMYVPFLHPLVANSFDKVYLSPLRFLWLQLNWPNDFNVYKPCLLYTSPSPRD